MTSKPIIAVVGATGLQGGSVVRALKEQGRFRIRALTRNPDKHAALADEVVRADLTEPASLERAFEGAYGVFAVTNFWEKSSVDEVTQGQHAVTAAKAKGVEHFVWSSLPDVERISGGKYHVPHFTGKAAVNAIVRNAGFRYATFVEAPFYFQNLTSVMAPQPFDDGTRGWMLPIDPSARCIHMGDITDFGKVVAGAFAHPEKVGAGQILSSTSGLMSFDDVVATLNAQGHRISFRRIPAETFASFFPGAGEMAAMLAYFEAYSYMGPDAEAKIALARNVATGPMTDFVTWAKAQMPREGAS